MTLERRISAERFAPYRAAAGDDLNRAIRLYERNAELSAAFWAVLMGVPDQTAVDSRTIEGPGPAF
jgi:hypothetical protein